MKGPNLTYPAIGAHLIKEKICLGKKEKDSEIKSSGSYMRKRNHVRGTQKASTSRSKIDDEKHFMGDVRDQGKKKTRGKT